MSTKTDIATTAKARTKTSTRHRTAKRQPAGAPAVRPALEDQQDALLTKRPASEVTRLVFMALLGCAASIALVGVVAQATATPAGTSPDDPAPAVIVELAD